MSDPVFFKPAVRPTLADIVEWTRATPKGEVDLARVIARVGPLESGEPDTLVFLDNPKYVALLEATRAAACLLAPRYAAKVPAGTVALVIDEPYRAMASVLAKLFPDAMRPGSLFGGAGIAPGVSIHPEARLEEGVVADPGCVIGPRAEIGQGTVLGPNVVIGPDVRVGRGCAIGAGASVTHAMIGDRVVIHPGARIGQDGFGFAMGARGHTKVPQVGRVIIQDDVEIGANTTIDRGANRDTTIGEGTKIDNLVMIAHNVTIGRHCVIVSQVGISGSTDIADFAALGGQAGLTGHLKIGAGAQIAAQAGVMRDVPAGETVFGSPARPIKEHFRMMTAIDRLLGLKRAKGSPDHG